MSGSSKETYLYLLKIALDSVVLPDCLGPNRATTGNSFAKIYNSLSSFRGIITQ